jgi:hypothetical protein
MRNEFYLSKGQTNMKLFAFAALLALPFLGLGAQSASADYYCCGGHQRAEYKIGYTYAIKNSVIFDCDSHYCKTKIKIYEGTKVKVHCRNGWCNIKNFPFENVWVLEECLQPFGNEGYGHGQEYGGQGEYNGENDQGYDH